MKYKVIKKFPKGPIVGTIMETVGYWAYEKGKMHLTLQTNDIESSPEFFAPFYKTTEEGLDLYIGDKVFFAHDVSTKEPSYVIEEFIVSKWFSINKRIFSTREAAQKWIDEQNKPKYEVGQWLFTSSELSRIIFRFKEEVDGKYSTDEYYQIWNSTDEVIGQGKGKDDYLTHNTNITKATPEQIQDVLSRVAIHKGFKEGVKYYNARRGGIVHPCYSTNTFQYEFDGLYPKGYGASGWVYHQGIWGEIIKKTITESIKEITITLDGDVVNTSHWGNNVKITYK